MIIKKRLFITISSIVILLILIARFENNVEEPGISYVDWSDKNMRAQQIVTALYNGDFTVVVEGFDDDLKRTLGLRGLTSSFLGMHRIAGEYISIGEINYILFLDVGYSFEIYNITTLHEHKELITRIVFNTDGSVAGIWFVFVEEG